MAVSWGIRFSAIVLLAALALSLAVLLPGGSSERADAAAPRTVPSQARFLLRLPDLPPGYRLAASAEFSAASGIRCAPIEPTDPRPQLERFLRRAPAGCTAFYGRAFRGPGPGPAPAFVGSGVMRLKSIAAAEEGLDLAPQLISHAIGDELPVEIAVQAQVGERTRLFHWSYPGLFDEELATFLVWRWGGAVAAIFAAGGDGAANDAAALALAQRQQHHLEEPEPFSPAEFDDTEVPLENPAIDVPIYWLGRDLAARPGLPALHLQNTSSSSPAETGRPRAGTYYEDRPLRARGEGVYVDVYSATQWKRFKARGNLPGALECGATARPIKLPRGHAVAFHGRARLFRQCDRRELTEWVLRAHVGGVVVTASTIESCRTCAEPGRGPYNSYKGMRAIARGLELRQP